MPVFQILTLHQLKSFLEDSPNLKGNLLSLDKIATALFPLSRERLVFVSNNIDKLVGSNLSFLVQGFPMLVKRLAFLDSEDYQNFKETIETIEFKFFDSFTSNASKLEILMGIMQLASSKKEQVRSFVKYIDLNFHQNELSSIQKICRDLSSLSRERLTFISNNMDKFLGSDSCLSAHNFPLIIECLAFLNEEHYKNFNKIIETIGAKLFEPLASNASKLEVFLEIMQLASLKKEQLRSFIEYIDFSFISNNDDEHLKMIKDWKFMELFLGWE